MTDTMIEKTATDIIYKALGGDKNPAAASLVASICWELGNNDWMFAKESELRDLEAAQADARALVWEILSLIKPTLVGDGGDGYLNMYNTDNIGIAVTKAQAFMEGK